MKKNILAILTVAAFLFSACDKINPDEYTTQAGGGDSNWQNVHVQRALVEKYTGPKCPNCPNADVTLDAAHAQYGDRLIIISVNHPTGQGEPFANQPDLRTEDGTAWDTWLGINSIPAAYLNRNRATQYTGSMSDIMGAIGDMIARDPLCDIAVTATATGDSITIDVDVEFLNTIEEATTITLALTEDSLVYKQSMPDGSRQDDYVHNHMLRDVITATFGDDVPMQGIAGEHKVGRYTYRLPDVEPAIVPANCHIVAFLSYRDSRKIINSAECTIQ